MLAKQVKLSHDNKHCQHVVLIRITSAAHNFKSKSTLKHGAPICACNICDKKVVRGIREYWIALVPTFEGCYVHASHDTYREVIPQMAIDELAVVGWNSNCI